MTHTPCLGCKLQFINCPPPHHMHMARHAMARWQAEEARLCTYNQGECPKTRSCEPATAPPQPRPALPCPAPPRPIATPPSPSKSHTKSRSVLRLDNRP